MPYYLDLFSPETYEAFLKSSQDISGFRIRQLNAAKKIHAGDKLLCYITKLSRWFGVLEVQSEQFIDDTPIFYSENDPFVVRFKVKPLIWLPKEKAIPIHEEEVWSKLSFTKDHDKKSSTWTGKIRSSLVKIEDEDGKFIEELMMSQESNGKEYPVNEGEYRKFVTQRIRRQDKVVSVTVPEDETEHEKEGEQHLVRESIQMQALLAQLGEKMGFNVWIPRSDRAQVVSKWQPAEGVLLDILPLNYNEATLKTIERIDVIWLKRSSIIRAFEVEHTTSIFSGILRMADLLALQPNMDIRLHIVAPYYRRDKVFEEIQRPVFSLLEKAPLSEICTYISYDSLLELSGEKHLHHLSDAVLDDYAEEPE